MAIFRKHKVSNYTSIDNDIFKNSKLSYKATGLLCLMLSLPEDWDFTIDGLEKMKTENKTAIRTGLKELEENGYLVRSRQRNEKGVLLGTIYDIYEQPKLENQTQVKPKLEKPTLEKPTLENRTQLNTNIIKDLNNKKENKKRKYFDDVELNDLFIEFLDIRKKLKAVNSELAINKLLKILSNYDNDIKKQMIENSIVNSWKSVYELKNTKPKEQLPDWFNKEIKREEISDERKAKAEAIRNGTYRP